MANNFAAAVHLGISIDESFAEFSLVKNTTPYEVLANKRVYIPRDSLKTSLPAFLTEFAEHKPSLAFVSMRFLEKILDYKLGNSVAQLVSAGFENWMQIRSSHPNLQNLSNPELIFSVQERVLADGRILEEPSDESLEIIESKLKLMEVKRVCLNFLHSQVQPQNLKRVQDFLTERGFDVFSGVGIDNPDEVSRWRANTLNASVTSTFLELKEQIEEACKDLIATEKIHYLCSSKKVFQNEKQYRIGSLYSTRSAILHKQRNTTELLYLGLEKFSWLNRQVEKCWQSPWGLMDLEHPFCEDLQIQPTSLIAQNSFGELDFSEKNEGYEPGPMCMGRGQKPTLLDVFADDDKLKKTQGICERITAPGIQRFRSAMMAMAKSTQKSVGNSQDVEKIIRQLRALALQRIAIEVDLKSSANVKVIGPLSSVLGPELKAQYGWDISSEKFVDSISVAIAGYEWMGK